MAYLAQHAVDPYLRVHARVTCMTHFVASSCFCFVPLPQQEAPVPEDSAKDAPASKDTSTAPPADEKPAAASANTSEGEKAGDEKTGAHIWIFWNVL